MADKLQAGLIVICGPTATGKSGLALQLAQEWQSVILSADSRACYREFDIGTAKPAIAAQQQVPHYFIDICDPTTTLTVAEFQQDAQALIAKFHAGSDPGDAARVNGEALLNSRFPFLVGGTGLYIRAVTKGLQIPRVAPQINLRSQLEALGQVHLYALLQQVDPASAQRIHPHDPVRTLRALEVFYVTGRPISEQQGENPPAYPILQIGLDCADPQALTQRIKQRTRQMLEAGLVAEVEHLCQKYGADLPLLDTLGYREIKQYLAGEVSLAEAEELIVIHTRQFAKRQRTWFRTDPTIEWFDADASDLSKQVRQRLQEFCGFL